MSAASALDRVTLGRVPSIQSAPRIDLGIHLFARLRCTLDPRDKPEGDRLGSSERRKNIGPASEDGLPLEQLAP